MCANEHVVLVVDPLGLRREGLSALLADWAESHGFGIEGIGSYDPMTIASIRNCKLCVLCCRACTEEEEIGPTLRILTALDPVRPVIVVSDTALPKQMLAAYRHGARGFVPSLVEPSFLRDTLSFILAGGTYYPPEVLQLRRPRVETPAQEAEDEKAAQSTGRLASGPVAAAGADGKGADIPDPLRLRRASLKPTVHPFTKGPAKDQER